MHYIYYITYHLDAARRPAMVAIDESSRVTRGPVVLTPRSEAASAFWHDVASREAFFRLRLFSADVPSVEIQVRLGGWVCVCVCVGENEIGGEGGRLGWCVCSWTRWWVDTTRATNSA